MFHKNFKFLWLSQIVSSFGNKLTIFGLPLVGIFIYNTTVLETSIITILSFLPSLLFGTVVGIIVDKGNKRKIGIITNIVCFIISIILFIFSFLKILPLYLFYILIFFLNTFLLFGSLSFYSQVPIVLPKEQLKKGNYKLEVSNSIIDTTAPSIAGLIFTVLSAPFIFIIDGITFILASICQFFIVDEEQTIERNNNNNYKVHIQSAYKYVYKNKLLLGLAISYFIMVFGIGIFQSIQFYYLSKILNISATTIGIIMSIGNIGLVISSLCSLKISNKLGSGKTIILSIFLYGLAFSLYYMSDNHSVILLIIANICIGGAMPLYNINATTIRQKNVDLSILGSVSAIWRIFGRGLIPLGAIIGGTISTYFSVKATIFLSIIFIVLSIITVYFSKELRNYIE